MQATPQLPELTGALQQSLPPKGAHQPGSEDLRAQALAVAAVRVGVARRAGRLLPVPPPASRSQGQVLGF